MSHVINRIGLTHLCESQSSKVSRFRLSFRCATSVSLCLCGCFFSALLPQRHRDTEGVSLPDRLWIEVLLLVRGRDVDSVSA
jgi:hypothetical protein